MKTCIRTTWTSTVLAGTFLLGGCAATHVGEDWQCPLIQGAPCQSVVDADPAGAGARQGASAGLGVGAGGGTVRGRADEEERSDPCDRGCRPSARTRRGLAAGNGLTGGSVVAGVKARTGSSGLAAVGPAIRWADPGAGETDRGDLRTPEVIGRIWIAPYVDAEGVYREASWVRVVLQPARWRLP